MLYKYLSLNDEVLQSLTQSYFRFTQTNVLNDKFEGNFGFNSDEVTAEDFRAYLLKDSLLGAPIKYASSLDIIRMNSIFPVDVMNPHNAPGAYTGDLSEKKLHKASYIRALRESIEDEIHELCVFSMTKRLNSQVMWSHYGNQEKGIIIGFNSNHSFFSDAKPVKYSNVRPNYRVLEDDYLNSIGTHYSKIYNFIEESILTKSVPWKYEREYRLVRKNSECSKTKENETDNPLYLFTIPFSAWDAVYFGPSINCKYESYLMNMLYSRSDCSHIKMFNVFKDDQLFKYHSILRNT